MGSITPEQNSTTPLYQKLRAYRREAHISADIVASRIGMTPSSLRARERGEREWYPELVQQFLTAVQECARESNRDVPSLGDLRRFTRKPRESRGRVEVVAPTGPDLRWTQINATNWVASGWRVMRQSRTNLYRLFAPDGTQAMEGPSRGEMMEEARKRHAERQTA